MRIVIDVPENDRHRYSVMAFTEVMDGSTMYVGDLHDFQTLLNRGIRPELASKDKNVCSVGYCEREKKWYGWSHRAIFGFDTRAEAVEFAASVS
jgi:hypothetical protein